ncbi:flagellar motor switch protein FliN [Thiocystis violascens]|uniref:Flagellar motor switch protein FliN n=1 Tax=Thiocystis violascens (strain ATCC 17096 / DSM 198 / 6111) TaxID=765911 RepID=I3Y617_THIV6|nr:flagellar motor switch protein FliN [Thiocystis violascens]AFL72435.1 flagellar motor switch protein FliN [Thiocystis violascens DSM 198]
MSTDTDTDLDPNDAIADDWAAALEEQKDATTESAASAAVPPPARDAAPQRGAGERTPASANRGVGGGSMDALQAKPMNPEDFSGMQASGREDLNLNMLLDVPVTIAMEIGRTKIAIRNLLQLNQGSVVELDRLAGEPLDVLVNGTLIAHGEVVVVNEKFGIRLTDVISPSERVRKLR